MINSDKCPKCLNDWYKFSPINYRCVECKFITKIDRGDHFRWLRLNIAVDQYIFWYFDNQNCVYSHYRSDAFFLKVREINLPWLPYDITLEQLQIYLAFS